MSVPRTLHQLWIGDKAMPNRERKWSLQFKSMNPRWTHKMHGNELFTRYAADPYVRILKERGESLAFIADRFRVLLLRDEGGIYIDVDAKPVRALDTIASVWDDPRVDFVAGLRSPDRKGVAVHRGIPVMDNTVFASALNGRMANRLCSLYEPEGKKVKQNGYSQGLEVLRSLDASTVLLNYKYFYSEIEYPETILLHDGHNLGSWVPKIPDPLAVPV